MYFLSLLVFLILFKVYQKLSAAKCQCTAVLAGKVIIITGANSGIGLETAKDLARRGARVILACRNEAKGRSTQELIIRETGNKNVIYKHLDLSSLTSVRNFVEEFKCHEGRLDVLINNAGVVEERGYTEDGILRDMQVNHFAHFLLTILLIPLLKRASSGRIVNVSSAAHFGGVVDLKNINKEGQYGFLKRYCNNKLCNVLFTVELAKRLQGSGVTANSLHPGVVHSTYISSKVGFILSKLSAVSYYIFFKSPEEGAQTSIHVAVSEECGKVSGKYFLDCRQGWMTWKAKDGALTADLWDYSIGLVKLKPSEICL